MTAKQTQQPAIDGETLRSALCETLKRLPGIEYAFETTAGVCAEAKGGRVFRIEIAQERGPMPHTVEIIDDAVIVLDADGNGCDCHELDGLRQAKRQLRRWQDEYTFDYAGALRAVSDYFANR